VVIEHWDAFDGSDGGFWTELDAAANVALSDLPVAMTCFYPAYPLHEAVLSGARRNHRTVLRSGRIADNADYLSPQECLRASPAPAPMVLGPPDERRTFGAWALNEVRASVATMLLAAGFGRDRADDVVLAVNEIATNAVEHGPATPRSTCGSTPTASWPRCTTGRAGQPVAGAHGAAPGGARGRGVWIARQLCDSLHVVGQRRGHARPAARSALTYGRIRVRVEGLRSVTG
jgi:hypothetical protein